MASLTDFGKAVRIARIQTGVTLKVMADSLGVSPAYLSAVETGAKPLNEKITQGVADFLVTHGVDVAPVFQAADRTINTRDVSNLNSDEKEAIAAFARFSSANGNRTNSLLSESAKARLREFLKEH